MSFEYQPTISSEGNRGGKRVVSFKRGGPEKFEKPSFEMMTYADYISREAGRRGLDEKMGQMVNKVTRKVDRGQECEQSLLGRCVIARNEKIPVPVGRNPVSYEKAKSELFDFARNHQPSESEKSESNISGEVELMIGDKLKESGVDIADVRFRTAVGTPLDYQCGVDGWVEIVSQGEGREIITFDLKTGAARDSSIQADIMLKLDLESDGFTPDQKLAELSGFTGNVVDIYRERVHLSSN
ncbi:hypothetical protein ACFL08_00630 [Patescibacteria group bacterium]